MADQPLVTEHSHDTADGQVLVELRWDQIDNAMACVSVTITAGMPLTATTLKTLPFKTMLENGRWTAVERLRSNESDAVWKVWIEEAAGHQRRRQYGDDHYRLVASMYLELRRNSASKPTSRLARHFDVNVATARRWIAGARERGLLEGL